MSKETFRYSVEVKYINNNNEEIKIEQSQINNIAIHKDFDVNVMPIIGLSASIEKNILDDLINNANSYTITLSIYKYDIQNQYDNITTKCFSEKFIYFLPDDKSRTYKIDYEEGDEDNENKNDLFRDVIIWLLPQRCVNNIRRSLNGVYKNVSMNSLILQITNYIGKLLLEPITYDTKFRQLIIPPHDSITDYLTYLNNQVGVFYDTPYRFFMDFGMSYIVSSSGKITKSINQSIYTININIYDIFPNQYSEEPGMYIDKTNNKYVIDINSSVVNYNRNLVSNKMVNNIITVDSSGNVTSKDIKNNKIEVTDNRIFSQTIMLSNNDKNAINNIISSYENSNVDIVIIKNDLDASIFTINKEYIINDYFHEEYSGKYLLVNIRQLYMKQADRFIMCSILDLRKINS